MRSSWTRSAGAAVVCLIGFALAGCADGIPSDPGGADPIGPAFDKPPHAGGGGGKDKGGDSGPSAGDVETAFADAVGDRIRSDGAGSYLPVKKQQRVESKVTHDGRHHLQVNENSGRELCVTFPPPGDDVVIVSEDDWQDLLGRQDPSGESVALGDTYCGLATMHTRDHSEAGKLLGMDTDPSTAATDVQTSGGKVALKEFDVAQSWEWRLLFDDQFTAVNDGNQKNGVCILLNDDGSWTIGNDRAIDDDSDAPGTCDVVDDWVNLIRVQGDGTYTHVASFRMPFRYTVTPL